MTTLREEVARAILETGVVAHLDDALDLQETLAIADAVIPIILGRAAEVCATLAETTYDDVDGFQAALGCEAAIRQIGRGE